MADSQTDRGTELGDAGVARDASSAVFHYDLDAEYPVAEGGERCWIVDSAGNRWLDAGGGAGAVTIGYGIESIANAIARQARAHAFAYSRTFTTNAQEELARALVSLTPSASGLAYFVSGGSEANESAIKMARLYHLERNHPSKYKVVSRWPSYHGNTLATLGLSGRPSWSQPFDPLLGPRYQIPAPYALHSSLDMGAKDYGDWCADQLEDLILREGPETISAFIAEPIIGGTAPAVGPPDNYWPRIREICTRYDVLLIIDEVLTGFGRTGRNFGIQHYSTDPDMITCAKGITSGYMPLGAVIISEQVASAFRGGSRRLRHSFTYAGHPVACAAGLAAVQILVDQELSARAMELGSTLLTLVQRHVAPDSLVAEVRGMGLLVGIEFKTPSALSSSQAVGTRISDKVVTWARRERVILTPATNGDQIQLLPPIMTEPQELERIVDVVVGGLASIERER